jgi:hypothetical protein
MIITEFLTKRQVEIRDDMWDSRMKTFGVVAVTNGTTQEDMFVKAGLVSSRREARELKNNLIIECQDLDVFLLCRTRKKNPISFRFVVIEQDYELDKS